MVALAVIDINLTKVMAPVRCRLRLANASDRGHTTINLQEFEKNVVCPQFFSVLWVINHTGVTDAEVWGAELELSAPLNSSPNNPVGRARPLSYCVLSTTLGAPSSRLMKRRD